eukprot:m.1215545 g.1215545  ORF g.1215545 m.1215545 type:complete len:319 (-) comp24612_c1_seq1:2192-3148(-)
MSIRGSAELNYSSGRPRSSLRRIPSAPHIRPLPSVSIPRTLELLQPSRRTEPCSSSSSGHQTLSASAAINFELTVLENAKDYGQCGFSAKHSMRLFQVFDDVIPLLGVHSRVLKLLRDELYEAIHSAEYTTVITTGGDRIPHRQPYLAVIERYHKQSQELVKNAQDDVIYCQDTLQTTTERFHRQKKALEELLQIKSIQANEAMDRSISTQSEKNIMEQRTQTEIANLRNENNEKDKRIQFLQGQVHSLQRKLTNMAPYRKSYDALLLMCLQTRATILFWFLYGVRIFFTSSRVFVCIADTTTWKNCLTNLGLVKAQL